MALDQQTTTQAKKYFVRHLEEVNTFRSVCGFRKSLITPEDSPVVGLSFLDISDSRKHYHKSVTEVYYCLSGKGEMELENEVVTLEPGTVVYIPPGVRHTARGNVQVLIISVPPFETGDVHFDEER